MAGYEKFVKEIGIDFEWKINKDTEKLEYRDLTGPEKLLLFQHINFHLLLPEFHDVDELQALWGNFIDIIGDLNLNYTTDDAILFLDLYKRCNKRCNTIYAFFVCSCSWIFKAIPKFSIL